MLHGLSRYRQTTFNTASARTAWRELVSHQHDLPHRSGFLQPAPDGDSRNPCLGYSQEHQQHEGGHDGLVNAVTAEAKGDVRDGLVM